MLSALARLTQSLSRLAIALMLGLSLLLTACSGEADARLTGGINMLIIYVYKN